MTHLPHSPVIALLTGVLLLAACSGGSLCAGSDEEERQNKQSPWATLPAAPEQTAAAKTVTDPTAPMGATPAQSPAPSPAPVSATPPVSLSVDTPAGPCPPGPAPTGGGAITVTPTRLPAGWSSEGVLQGQWRIDNPRVTPTPLLFLTRESDVLDDGLGRGPYRMISAVLVAAAKATEADFCAGTLGLFGPIGALQPTVTTLGGLRALRVQLNLGYGPDDPRPTTYHFVPTGAGEGAVVYTTRTYPPGQGRTPASIALGQSMDADMDAIIRGLVFQVAGKPLP